MCESVHTENCLNAVSQKAVKGILPNFGHSLIDVFGFIDVLIRFWGQKVKLTGQ